MASARDTATSIILSVLVHGGVLALLVVGFLNFRPSVQPRPVQLPIEAAVVDEQRIRDEMTRQQREEEELAQRKLQEEQRAEQLKREREAEERKLEEVRQERAAEEEAERQRVEQRKLEEEKRAQAEAEAKKKAEEQKAAADRKRKEQEARKKEEEARLRAEREAQLKRQMEEEERRQQAVNAGLLEQYTAMIQARIQRAWNRPPSARAGLDCVVYVTQVPGGEVTSVRVGECNGDDIVRQSIEAAVYRASPLPEPPDPALFERNLRLRFRPDA